MRNRKPQTVVAAVMAASLLGCASSKPQPVSVASGLTADLQRADLQTADLQARSDAVSREDKSADVQPSVKPVNHTEASHAETIETETVVDESFDASLPLAKLISDAEFVVDLEETLVSSSDLQDEGVDLASLEALAESRHPELQQSSALVAQARGKARQAILPYNPVMQYQSDEIGIGGVSGMHSVGLSQRFVTANKLEIAQQQQLHLVQQRLAEYEYARLRVLTRVRTAYAEMQVAQQRAIITQSIADIAGRSVETVNSLMDAGEVSRIALLQSQVEAQRAELAHQNALATLDQARRSLTAAVGVRELPTDRVQDDLPEQLPEQPWATLVDEIASLSPQVGSASSQLEQARWALRLACAQVTPDVTGQVSVGYDAGTDDTFAMVGVSVPLPVRNRNQGNIRAARAQVSASSANISRTSLELQQALADAVGRYEVARQTYTQIRSEISPAANEAYDLARKAFGSGEADFLQVLTAQRTWFDARLAAINALQNAKTADAEIRGALTLVVDSSL